MKVLGLTGGIASGKSAVAAMLRGRGVAVFDADREVHRLLAEDMEIVAAVVAAFPEVGGAAIDRAALGKIVFKDAEALRRLETILHPHVRAAEETFLAMRRAEGDAIAALEIPLLFETGAQDLCHLVMVTFAPLEVRRERALVRAGMTEEKWNDILARQWTDEIRNAAADYIIDTSGTHEQTERQVAEVLHEIAAS